MSIETMHWYRSKIDWWLAPLLFAAPVIAVGVCVALALGEKTSAWMGLPAVILVFGIYVGLLFPMRYALDDTHLLIRFGLCRQRIPLREISEVHRTHNPLSSPALSLDRLYVKFGPRFTNATMISPVNRDRFLDELAQKAGLQRQGDRLVRG
jgi:hypothetical protein